MLACIPSLMNTPRIFLSIRDGYNLIAFVIAIISTSIAMKSHKKIILIFYAFISGMSIHSIIVIFQCLTSGKRAFGIMSVFYVDFAALAALYCLIFFFYAEGNKRFFWLFISGLNLFGLILTQTRNAWISFAFGAFALLFYLLVKHKKYKLSRKLVFSTLIIFAFVAMSAYFTAIALNPKISERFEMKGKNVSTERLSDVFGQNSLATRSLIWYTAYDAFKTSPIFGIGVYAFKHTSTWYYTIPDDLFEYFVEGKTPHLTYIEVITETGIFGFIFFIYFLYSITKFFRKCLILEQTKGESMRTLLISWTFVYIIFSMFMTEAWLYGQFLMWFGIMIGLSSGNYILITSKQTKSVC